MNKILTLFVLVPSVFYGINDSSTTAQVPQSIFQEIYIEGYSNQVTQQLNQTLNLHFINLPEIKGSVIPNINIQGTFLDNPNNKVNQAINQNVVDLGLIPLNSKNFMINDFIGNDKVLNGVQFSEQQVLIQGNNNFSNQVNSQNLSNFLFLEQSNKITETEEFYKFISQLLEIKLLDSFQFSSQDSLVFGDRNIVNQNISQTVDTFIFFASDFQLLLDKTVEKANNFVKPSQFTIQETFINASDNNIITQSINQSIQQLSLIEYGIYSEDNYLLSEFKMDKIKSDNLVGFSIDAFIDEILNNTIIEGQQINRQFLEVIGNSNQNLQENEQVIDLVGSQEPSVFTANEPNSLVSVPEPSNLRIMIVLLGIMGIGWYQSR
ncbi:hypothetical protein [Crocosphaera sp.]|uniref:hypothetical protein n=1 Tax=Crocosphaera sp. TaxID=2729996 RepID=UPI003F203F7A|nr:hypothetical protein [Crocosphaera sp.]